MPDEHEFFSQPHGNPAWCFCRLPHCTGWAAYVKSFQAGNRTTDEPDDDAIETARKITRTLAGLTRHYSDLFGIKVDYNTALDLAAIDREQGRPAESPRLAPSGITAPLRPRAPRARGAN
jgi:hypothetical protein